jgi:hypothetical protein
MKMAGYPSIDGMVTVVFITTYHKTYSAFDIILYNE